MTTSGAETSMMVPLVESRTDTIPPPSGNAALAICYPEIGAGGFSRSDTTIEFYTRLNALLRSDRVVADIGAGRGKAADDPVPYRRALRILRGRVARVIGLDVDPIVRSNPLLDEAQVIEAAGPLPLADGSVDTVLCDWTFEHVQDPQAFVRELERVLKPGGWICARTTNRWGYIGLGASLVPNRLHTSILRSLQPHRREEDVFPTYYRMNSLGAIGKLFPSQRFRNFTYSVTGEPAYFGNRLMLWRLAQLGARLTPGGAGAVLLVFVQKLR